MVDFALKPADVLQPHGVLTDVQLRLPCALMHALSCELDGPSPL